MACRRRLVQVLAQHACVDKPCQAVGEHGPRYLESIQKFIEAAHAEKAIAQDQEGPAIADHGQGPRQRTLLLLQIIPFHGGPLLDGFRF